MKLKKIASLMLAGVMAVSMLTACAEGGKNEEDNSASSEAPTVNGAAAALNAALSRNKDTITFENDDELNKDLEAYFSLHPIMGDTWNSKNYVVDDYTTDTALNNVIGSNWTGWPSLSNLATAKQDDGAHDGKSVAWISMYNTAVYTQADALKTVGKAIDSLDFVDDKNNTDDGKMYSFSGNASVLEVKSEKGAASVWVVVVTVTKDYVAV